jgi:hypothetical protein
MEYEMRETHQTIHESEDTTYNVNEAEDEQGDNGLTFVLRSSVVCHRCKRAVLSHPMTETQLRMTAVRQLDAHEERKADRI